MTGYIVTGEPLQWEPDDPPGIAAALVRAARVAPEAGVGAVSSQGRSTLLPYPVFLYRARRLLSGLRAAGLDPGDTVILQVDGVHEHLIAMWGCLLGGIRPLVATVPETPERWEPHVERLRHAWEALERPPILVDDVANSPAGRLTDAVLLPLAELSDHAADTTTATERPGEPVMYLMSSGSTGRPKVIGLTDRGLRELGAGARRQLGMAVGDGCFNWLPLDHSGALLLYHVAPVYLAATNWHSPTGRILADPLRWLTDTAALGAHHTWSPNFGYRLVSDAIARRGLPDVDLSAVKTLVSGGEQILPEVMDTFLADVAPTGLTPGVFRPCWGMTETTTAIAFGRYDHPHATVLVGDRRLVGVGEPSPGAEFRVTGPDGGTLPEGEIGALQVRSGRVTCGHAGDPQADREAFTSDGWLRTGDMAMLLDGRLTITGRQKDVIILNGDNHDCHRIESVVAEVPGIRADRVAAVGVPDAARGTETLTVVFVPVEPGAAAEPTALIDAARARVAQRLGLTAAIVIAVPEHEFPVTGSGKIQRAVIRRRLTDLAPGGARPPADPNPPRPPAAPRTPPAAAPAAEPAAPVTWRTRKPAPEPAPTPPQTPAPAAAAPPPHDEWTAANPSWAHIPRRTGDPAPASPDAMEPETPPTPDAATPAETATTATPAPSRPAQQAPVTPTVPEPAATAEAAPSPAIEPRPHAAPDTTAPAATEVTATADSVAPAADTTPSMVEEMPPGPPTPRVPENAPATTDEAPAPVATTEDATSAPAEAARTEVEPESSTPADTEDTPGFAVAVRASLRRARSPLDEAAAPAPDTAEVTTTHAAPSDDVPTPVAPAGDPAPSASQAAVIGTEAPADEEAAAPAPSLGHDPAASASRAAVLDTVDAAPADLAGDSAAAPAEEPAADPAGNPTGDHRRVRAHVLAACRDVYGHDLDLDRPLYEQGVDSVRLPALAEALTARTGHDVDTTTLLRHGDLDGLVAELTGTGRAGDAVTVTAPDVTTDDRIAVIGMAARFPGADDLDRYWTNILSGVDSIRRFDDETLAAAGIPTHVYRNPDYVPVSGTLGEGSPEAVAEFDADLFGVPAAEAALTDPQQRIFLEVCQQALEDAGRAGAGERVGLYAGCGMNLYAGHDYLSSNLARLSTDPVAAMQIAIGNRPDFLATRVAYRLGLTGPAVTVQTACSTGLVAVHQAVRALQAGDTDVALAGAASLHIPATTGYTCVEGTMMSPTGRCRSFDADADGTVGGNGVAVVVLKRLDRAVADGDTVHAVVAGTAVNNDGGDKVGFTAPSVSGQVAAITAAMDAAGVTAEQVGYVEAHGTGTRLGDPVEVRALTEAYDSRRSGGTPYRVRLGSVKANIGHLDACAGMAGLIKVILMLRHRTIPPQIHFRRLNPAIAPGPFHVGTDAADWPAGPHPRTAAVQALGVGGTNAHVVVQEAPAPVAHPRRAPGGAILTGHTPEALRELADGLAARLREPDAPDVSDVFTTTALGRPHRRHRIAVFADTAAELAAALTRATATDSAGRPGPPAFVFSGQGALRNGFARSLYDHSRDFADIVDRCVTACPDPDLTAALLTPDDRPVTTALVQPAMFTFQAATLAAWRALGVAPGIVAGHSVGEYAAWHAAGAMDAETGVRVTALRGALTARRTPEGGMLAVRADRRTVDAVLAVVDELDLAVVNGAREFVIAGDEAGIDAAAGLLSRRDVPTTRLPVRRAFHSRLLDGMLDDFAAGLRGETFSPTRIPLITCVDGRLLPPGTTPDVADLVSQTRRTARWDLVLDTAGTDDAHRFVEIGPEPVLTGIGRRNLPSAEWLAAGDPGAMTAAAGRLHCAGVPVDWRRLAAGGRRVPLPTHPFHRVRHWIDHDTTSP
ncbi:acyl transferase domain-containing protein [Stackebrandtia albiflava]|uniref:Acyl transferase domain-containing protein n=1 Tax=Stackebrandtia albiflava TaxID=406432 RepID=A0A562VAR9_9ACTN|nr:type I polyketide synthase [Stackebrandtia albiflava]TWJ14976.1 acyl transferase domain-containing protein [Stackebrandtia albiflava]